MSRFVQLEQDGKPLIVNTDHIAFASPAADPKTGAILLNKTGLASSMGTILVDGSIEEVTEVLNGEKQNISRLIN